MSQSRLLVFLVLRLLRQKKTPLPKPLLCVARERRNEKKSVFVFFSPFERERLLV